MALAGGRYDGLLKALWPPSAGPAMGAVGVTLNMDRLITMATPQHRRNRLPHLQASQVCGTHCALHVSNQLSCTLGL